MGGREPGLGFCAGRQSSVRLGLSTPRRGGGGGEREREKRRQRVLGLMEPPLDSGGSTVAVSEKYWILERESKGFCDLFVYIACYRVQAHSLARMILVI